MALSDYSGWPRLRSSVECRPLGNRNTGRDERRETVNRAAMREPKISALGLHALGVVPVHTSYQRTPLPWSSKPLHAISMFAVIAQCHTPSFANPHFGSQISPVARAKARVSENMIKNARMRGREASGEGAKV